VPAERLTTGRKTWLKPVRPPQPPLLRDSGLVSKPDRSGKWRDTVFELSYAPLLYAQMVEEKGGRYSVSERFVCEMPPAKGKRGEKPIQIEVAVVMTLQGGFR
jgi:hypothetical protein